MQFELQSHFCALTSWDEVFRIVLLLTEGLGERSYPCDHGSSHKEHGNNGPDHAPTLRGTPIPLSEDTGIGTVDFAEDEIIALNKG